LSLFLTENHPMKTHPLLN